MISLMVLPKTPEPLNLLGLSVQWLQTFELLAVVTLIAIYLQEFDGQKNMLYAIQRVQE